jgi:hypothetical protein
VCAAAPPAAAAADDDDDDDDHYDAAVEAAMAAAMRHLHLQLLFLPALAMLIAACYPRLSRLSREA